MAEKQPSRPLAAPQTLAVLHFPSLGEGLTQMQVFMADNRFKVVDMVPLQHGMDLLVTGALQDLEAKVATTSHGNSHFIENYRLEVMRALASLDNAAIEKNLLVIEGDSGGVLLQEAHRALPAQLKIVDLKIPRGAMEHGLLLLTHPDAEELTKFAHSCRLKSTVIAEVSPGFARYFDLSPAES